MIFEDIEWVEFSWFNWGTGDWSEWKRFTSEKAAVEYAHNTFGRGTVYKVQKIRCRTMKV